MNVNEQNYKWGNQYTASAWFAYTVCSRASVSLRVEGNEQTEISGYDKQIAPLMFNDPNADARNYGGEKVFTYLGVNLYQPRARLEGLRLMAEFGLPVYENLKGVQMRSAYRIQVGCHYTF